MRASIRLRSTFVETFVDATWPGIPELPARVMRPAAGLREIAGSAQEALLRLAFQGAAGDFFRRRLRPFRWRGFWRAMQDDQQIAAHKNRGDDDAETGRNGR